MLRLHRKQTFRFRPASLVYIVRRSALRCLTRGFLPWRLSEATPKSRCRPSWPASETVHNPGLYAVQHKVYSITSSARPSSEFGTLMPSVFAVFRLRISSTFIACCTGRSEGFSPWRMRPV